MKKLFLKITMVAAGISGVAVAQQDPQFTQFMFNKLIYNPGYAGTSGAICGVAQYRQQWVSFTGAPQSIALAGDMRLPMIPLGVGFNVISDKIGPMNTTYFRAAASWNFLRVAGGTLGVGLDLGFLQKKISDEWVVPEPLKNDPRIPGAYGSLGLSNPDLNTISFDLGAGVFYQIPGKFYAGLSSIHIPGKTKAGDNSLRFTNNRHYYFMTGYTFQLNAWSKLTPNILWKSSDSKSFSGAGDDAGQTNFMTTHSMDLNLTYLWSDMIWVGGSYRLNDAGAVLLGYQGKAMQGNALGYKIGLSYDFPTVSLRTYQRGSYELVLGVCYTPAVKKTTTYGNDRFLD